MEHKNFEIDYTNSEEIFMQYSMWQKKITNYT